MSEMLNNDGTLSITAMSLVEFLPAIERGFHNGFMLDLSKNEGVPQQYGSMLVLTMYPTDGVVQAREEFEEALQDAVEASEVRIGFDPTPYLEEKSPEVQTPIKVDGRRKKS